MKRSFLGLMIAILAFVPFTSAHGAATGHVTHFRFHATFAEALWATNTSQTLAAVSQGQGGQELQVDQFAFTFDSQGNTTGATDTFADVTSGFSFTIDPKLTNASVSGSGIPAQRCSYDANAFLIGCTNTSIAVSVSWTGEGPLARETSNDHLQIGKVKTTRHFNGTDRIATASGTVAGLAVATNNEVFGDIGRANSATVCIGTAFC
jgi:hypothetical protein